MRSAPARSFGFPVFAGRPLLQGLLVLLYIITGCVVPEPLAAQGRRIDSMLHWLAGHPAIDSARITTLHRVSYALSESDVSRAVTYYEQVSHLSDSLNFTYGKALASVNQGILLSSTGNYESSNRAFFKAIDFANACGARRLKAVALNNIGENFFSILSLEKSRTYAQEAIEINKVLNASRGVALNYELMQRGDLIESRFAAARKNLDTGWPWALQANENYIYSQFYLGYAKLYAVRGMTDSANYNFDLAYRTAREDGNLRNEYYVYVARATYLRGMKPADRITLLRHALEMAKQTGFLKGTATAADALSSVYDSLGRRDSALYFFRIFRAGTDSLFSESNRRNMVVNEVKQRVQEFKSLQDLTAAQEKQLAFKNILLFSIAIGFGLSLLVAFLSYKSVKAKRAEVESAFKQKIAETEMQALRAQMNPHFFFNSLNSIENFIMQSEKKLASDYLNKFARFIRSILDSSTSELIELHKDLASLQLYIDLEQLRFNDKFAYCCKTDPTLLEGEFYVPSLLVQPFLENAIIHGIGPSDRQDLRILLRVELKEGFIHYTIEDNGVGREQSKAYIDLNKPLHKSVGMKITQERIDIYNGTPATQPIKITDLYDAAGKAAGTRIEFAIKFVSNATAPGNID